MFNSFTDVLERLSAYNYLADRSVGVSVFLAEKLEKPLLVEGPAGVGKTELGNVLAMVKDTKLIRLQCYEGLDEAKALYEWNYQKQLLYIQSLTSPENKSWEKIQNDIYTMDFLLPRPLLKAFLSEEKAVLLIDEIDKSDEEFESFLLEALSEYQVTIPEYGTVKAKSKPFVIITSNNSRSLSDALKRRCLHLYIDYPELEREMKIIQLKVPGIKRELTEQLVRFVQSIRNMELKKAPSISESIDWARSLLAMGVESFGKEVVSNTLNVILKYHTDVTKVKKKLNTLFPA